VPGESVDVGGGQDTAVTAQGAAGWCEARQGRRGIYSSKGCVDKQLALAQYSSSPYLADSTCLHLQADHREGAAECGYE